MQGTAADIMKLAMIRVHSQLAARGLQARIVLQVHDELLVETPNTEQQVVSELLRAEMAGAAELLAPLKVDLKIGENWLEMNPLP